MKIFKKCNFGVKSKFRRNFYENVIKIASVTSKTYIYGRVKAQNDRFGKF